MSVDLIIYNTATTNKHLNRLARAVSTCQTGRRPTRYLHAVVTINHRGEVIESVMRPKRRENKETPRRLLHQISVNTVIITTVVGHYVMTTRPMLMTVNTIQKVLIILYNNILCCVKLEGRNGGRITAANFQHNIYVIIMRWAKEHYLFL